MTKGEYPFVTDRLNAPDGVNLMANTSVLGLGIPFAPVKLLWGAAVSYVVILLLGLAGTAYGWYWVFSRRLADRLIPSGGGLPAARNRPVRVLRSGTG